MNEEIARAGTLASDALRILGNPRHLVRAPGFGSATAFDLTTQIIENLGTLTGSGATNEGDQLGAATAMKDGGMMLVTGSDRIFSEGFEVSP